MTYYERGITNETDPFPSNKEIFYLSDRDECWGPLTAEIDTLEGKLGVQFSSIDSFGVYLDRELLVLFIERLTKVLTDYPEDEPNG